MPFSWAPMWHFKNAIGRGGFRNTTGLILCLNLVVVPLSNAEFHQDVADSLVHAQQLYQKACVLCHGNAGQGDGPDAFYIGAYSAPRPRDFTAAEFKFRSTPSGQLPTDDDLFGIITRGIPGFMPSFLGLSETDRWDLVAYVKSFSSGYQEFERIPIVLSPGPVPSTAVSIARGRELYDLLECGKCHSPQATQPGNLIDQEELRDRRELKVLPPDFRQPSAFKNGHRPREIAQSILTGLDGSPMASFREALSSQPDDIWHLVNFIISLSRGP